MQRSSILAAFPTDILCRGKPSSILNVYPQIHLLGGEMARWLSRRQLVGHFGTNITRYTDEDTPILGTGGYSFTCMVIETAEYVASLRWAKSIGKDGLQRLREHHFAVNNILAHHLPTIHSPNDMQRIGTLLLTKYWLHFRTWKPIRSKLPRG
jgi:hypothetical protein